MPLMYQKFLNNMVKDKIDFLIHIDSFAKLEENWDSYGAAPVPLGIREKVKRFIREYPLTPVAVFPSVNEDILLEYAVGKNEAQLHFEGETITLLLVITDPDYTKDVYLYEGPFEIERMNKFLNTIE